jgi:hypothetical protein
MATHIPFTPAIGATSPLISISNAGRRKHRADADHPTDPVRKFSYDVDDARAQPWRRIGIGTLPYGKAFISALNRTLRWLQAKQYAEGYTGPMRVQRSHRDVLKALLGKLDFATGRLDPAWATIANDALCGRSTVDRALETLHELGFISPIRRTQRTQEAEGRRGPQRKQTPNAFYFDCQARMEPEVFAQFWFTFLAELRAGGKWLLSRARAILNTFNSEAQPSPREPKVARLLAQARQRADKAPRRTPTPPRPLIRPNTATTPERCTAFGVRDEGLAASLTRMAAKLGLATDEAWNASPA